jgi:anti-sigma B factor antagonist
MDIMWRFRRLDPGRIGGALRLLLDTREVGRVTIVRCKGRIVAGSESESLRAHVAWLLRDRRSIVLHLGDVGFIDSSGLGTMVRTLTSTRQARGDLKLCDVPEHVRKVLEMSHLTKVFDTHESEEKAVAAFYLPGARSETPIRTSRSVLCLDRNADVLAYLRELLRCAGYDVHTTSYLRDTLILMRATHFDLLLVGPDMTASPATQQAFQAARASLAVIDLGSEFSTRDAGEAGAGLLQQIEARLNPKSR